MRDIVTFINESQDKGEMMLMDICQMWSDIDYDPAILKDKKKYKAVEKFWNWAQDNAEDVESLEDTKQYKEFIAAINA